MRPSALHPAPCTPAVSTHTAVLCTCSIYSVLLSYLYAGNTEHCADARFVMSRLVVDMRGDMAFPFGKEN